MSAGTYYSVYAKPLNERRIPLLHCMLTLFGDRFSEILPRFYEIKLCLTCTLLL